MANTMTLDFVRGNRASSVTIALTVAISSFLLSLLGAVMFNFWADGAAQAAAEGMDWQAQLTDELLVTAAFYLLVMLLACVALVLIIRNAFAASMRSRIHQLGILATVGATPQQLRGMLLRESLLLSVAPAIIGIGLGIAGGAAFVAAAIGLAEHMAPDRAQALQFRYSPWILLGCVVLVFGTVLASAAAPARKLSRISPLRAIVALPEEELRKPARPGAVARLFGIEGELAAGSVRLRRNSVRFASIALGLAFLIFAAFLAFMTASKMSVNETYYERYGTEWDLVIDVPDASVEQLQAVATEMDGASGMRDAMFALASGERLVVDAYDHGARFYVLDGGDGSSELFARTMEQTLQQYGFQDFTFVDMEREKQRAEDIWKGYATVVGGFCGLLALIGLAGVASQAIGFVYQRQREFARYRSVGMTPSGIYKMLCAEGILTVVRPLLMMLPLVIASALAFAVLGQQPLVAFAAEFPYGMLLGYLAAIFVIVTAAYAIGARRILQCNLPESLKNDVLV